MQGSWLGLLAGLLRLGQVSNRRTTAPSQDVTPTCLSLGQEKKGVARLDGRAVQEGGTCEGKKGSKGKEGKEKARSRLFARSAELTAQLCTSGSHARSSWEGEEGESRGAASPTRSLDVAHIID
ncbi:hypothetical protein GE09DRAFT_457262 [Coniochaeta sp. 2T2.1]|nr:hypothetical protein GE09DRAFT_457262 [Coniochaeta sp. 2T2.1]